MPQCLFKLYALCLIALFCNLGHAGKEPIISIVNGSFGHLEFSQDGKYLLASNPGGRVKLYHIESGKNILPYLGREYSYGFAAFAPHGRHLATIGNEITLIDITDFSRYNVTSRDYYSGKFTVDGKYLLLTNSSSQGYISVWDTHTWEEVNNIHVTDYTHFSIELSPDGKKIAVVPNHPNHFHNNSHIITEIQIFDLQTFERLLVLEGNKPTAYGTTCAVFSPDSRYLFSGGSDRILIVWDAENGKRIKEFSVPKGINDIDITPDGKYICVGNNSYGARIFDWEKKQQKWECVYNEKMVGVIVKVSPDGNSLAVSAREKGHIDIWDISGLTNPAHATPAETSTETPAFTPTPSKTQVPTPTPTPTWFPFSNTFTMGKPYDENDPNIIHDVKFLPDGNRIVTLDHRNRLIVWDKTNGKVLNETPIDVVEAEKLEIPNERQSIWASGRSNNSTKIYQFSQQNVDLIQEISIDSTYISWEIQQDESYLYYSIKNQGVYQTDLQTGQHQLIYPLSEDYNEIRHIKLSPSGQALAIAEWHWDNPVRESKVVIWDLSASREEREFHFHQHMVDEILWSADSQYLFFNTIDTRNNIEHFFNIDMFERLSGQHLTHLPIKDDCEISISPDGTRAFLGKWSKRGIASIIDLFSGEILRIFTHQCEVTSCTFNQDGTELLTGTRNSSEHTAPAYLWDIRDIPQGNIPDTLIPSTPTPTITPTPTPTPDQPNGYPGHYQMEKLNFKAGLLAIHPKTGDVISSYYASQENEVRTFQSLNDSGIVTHIETSHLSGENRSALNQSFNDMCVSQEGKIYLIGNQLVEFDPNNANRQIRTFDTEGRQIHAVSENDNIAGIQPGAILILRPPSVKSSDDDWRGWKYNELVSLDPSTNIPVTEILLTGEEMLQGNFLVDMTIGPEGYLFFASQYPNKLYFLNDNGVLEEYTHFLIALDNYWWGLKFTYSKRDNSFILITYSHLWKLYQEDRIPVNLASLSLSQSHILDSSNDGSKIYFSHRKRNGDEQLYVLQNNQTAPSPTPTPVNAQPSPTPTPVRGWFVLDGFGGIHPSNPDETIPVLPYFPDYNIVRDLEPDPKGKGWYMLDGFGDIHRSSPELPPPPVELPYFGFDIARSLEIKDSGEGYYFYLLDGLGAVHTNDKAFKFIHLPWGKKDIMRDLEPISNSNDWWVMDDTGQLYRNNDPVKDSFRYINGFNTSSIMRSFIRFPDDRTLMLDFYGGRHTNGNYPVHDKATSLPPDLYFPGWEIVWDIEIVPENYTP